MAETTTTSSIVRQAPFLEEIQRKILDQALARGETPIDVPEIQVAAQDPLTTQAIETGAGSGSFSNALYTKVGRLVHIALSFAFTGASGGLVIGNLPFTANNHSAGIGREDVTNGFTVHTMVTVNTTQINVRGSFATGNPSAYAVSAGTFRISLTYTTDS